ncbi:MAG TPA: aminotransferase class IV [Saprospiraceae bacterium]|nr:aminotransferase class IV [Saprospiraceae bacterium]
MENIEVPVRGFRSPFLETICILDGIPQHLEWHQRRIDETIQHFYPVHRHTWTLAECIEVPSVWQNGIVRCRIIYDAHLFTIHYYEYTQGKINSLQLVEAPAGTDYWYKYADRKILEDLYAQRGDADDVLISKDGWITDTSIANIAFEKNGRWYTPSIPLLAGTTWKRLVETGKIIPTPIAGSQVRNFDFFKVFNAMNDWERGEKISVEKILD